MEDNSKKVIVVGSGSAAFTAALAAKEAGLEPLVIESTDKLGAPPPCLAAGHEFPITH